MTLRSLLGPAVLPLLIATAGCTVTSSPGGGPTSSTSCGQDATVAGCLGGSRGYSCKGAFSPDVDITSLSCSDGTPGNGGETLYCCVDVAFAPNTCGKDTSVVGCAGPAIGFSCDGTSRPDETASSLVCSDGTPGDSGHTLYCCTSYTSPTADTCVQNRSVQGCDGSSIGFTCSGSNRPDQVNPSLVCGNGTANGAETLYCCNVAGTTPMPTAQCVADTALSCPSPSAGYSCTGGATPMQSDASLTCGTPGTGADDSTDYCCAPPVVTPPGCAADPAVTGCPGVATGYTCTGGTSPMTNTNLLCGDPMSGASGATSYCCTPNQ